MAKVKPLSRQSTLAPLKHKQREYLAGMRDSLLQCSETPSATMQAMQNITVMRVYHQILKIMKFTEMLDRLEEKKWEAFEYTLDTIDITDDFALNQLLAIENKLQKLMEDSNKLLQPFLNVKTFDVNSLMPTVTNAVQTNVSLDKETRKNIMDNAQVILAELTSLSEAEETSNE